MPILAVCVALALIGAGLCAVFRYALGRWPWER